MKKIMLLALLFAVIFGTAVYAKEVKVGLSASDNIIKNSAVIVGFDINDTFYECHEMYSQSGFRVEKGSFEETDTNIYSTYEEAKALCLPGEIPMLRSKGNWAKSAAGKDPVICVYSDSGLEFVYKNSYPLRFNPIDKDYTELSKSSYRGSIEYDINIKTINAVDINQYLYGVVPSEMPSSWPAEALKAQAAASRSYAEFSVHNHENDGYELCDTSHCQVYNGMAAETPEAVSAVDATKDEYIFYGGEVINAVFHSSSGGYTDSSENVWSVSYPYLTAVSDIYDTEGKRWSHTYSLASLSDETTGQVTSVILKIDSKTNRVYEMTLKGTNQDKTVSANSIKNILPGLESTMFSFSESEASSDTAVYAITAEGIYPVKGMTAQTANGTEKAGGFAVSSEGMSKLYPESAEEYRYVSSSSPNMIIYGKGWGHGVGMSQFGAKGMAENGFDYKQILAHYYSGTQINKME